jgi:hypothetical protein
VPDDTPEHWKRPCCGDHWVAIRTKTYEARQEQVDGFFGRRLFKLSHDLTYEHDTYAIFSFLLKEEADRFMQAFDGEPYDPRDRGGGPHWMHWYKGRAAKRDRNRSRYEF